VPTGALSVAVVGAGIGGLAAAIALRMIGHDVMVYEQAAKFGRVGAGINLTPNAVRVLDHLGAGRPLRNASSFPTYRVSRVWDSGEETSRLRMGDAAEQKYGSPQLTVHRADLLSALEALVPESSVKFGRRFVTCVDAGDGVELRFQDGSAERADLLIGCDGIHSPVRSALFGSEEPTFMNMSAFRATVAAERIPGYEIDAFVKWWGPEAKSQIVTMPLSGNRELFVFATVAERDWKFESWSRAGDVRELRAAYASFHPSARAVVDAVESTHKTALYAREPLSRWVRGRVAVLGDACHPMLPFMAQGAAMALEDAAILMRTLEHVRNDRDEIAHALRRYEATRQFRAGRIQVASGENEWLRNSADADWVYGYDALREPLAAV
jgi:salicylate hydroxylase